jgi:hypothetical protein
MPCAGREAGVTPFEHHVDQLLATLLASPRRKQRMREELLAHLTARLEAERREGAAEAEALQRALMGFGPVDAVRAELQASVPRWERMLHGRRVERREGESDMGCALRLTRSLTLWLALAVGVTFGAATFVVAHFSITPAVAAFMVGNAFALVASVPFIVLLYLVAVHSALKLERIVEGYEIRRALWMGLMCDLTLGAFGCLCWCVLEVRLESLEQPHVTWPGKLLGLVLVGGLHVLHIHDSRNAARREGWPA